MKALRWLLLGVWIALPATAGQAYIPFVAADPPGFDSGRSTIPDLELSNLGGLARRYSVRFVPAGENGLAGGELVQTDALAPGSFADVSCCDRGSGVLVVSGAPQIAVGARLDEMFNHAQPNGILTRLPVITARDAVPAGGRALLQALVWARNLEVTSSLGILNLGRGTARCSVSGFAGAADRFSDLLGFTVAPGSIAAFPDVIGQRLAPQSFTGYSARPIATCDQPFYPFAINYYLGGGLPFVEVVTPAVMLGNAP
jgi:hypothetical protein